MSSPLLVLQKWLRATIFLQWIIALAALLLTQQYTIFLRPEFGVLLVIGILVLVGFLASDSVGLHPRPLGLLEFVRGCILLLPLVYMLNSGKQGLDSTAFLKRSVGLPSVTSKNSTPVSPDHAGVPGPGQPASPKGRMEGIIPGDRRNAPVAAIEEVSLAEPIINPEEYQGKKISVIGIFSKNEKIREKFGENASVVFRFLINCCAADAIPLGMIILDSDQLEFPENTWVKATGVFDLGGDKENPLPLLNDVTMESIKAPKIPYLF